LVPYVSVFGRSLDVPSVSLSPNPVGLNCVYVTLNGISYSSPTMVQLMPGTYGYRCVGLSLLPCGSAVV